MDDIDAGRHLAVAEAAEIRFNWMHAPHDEPDVSSIYRRNGRWVVSTTDERASEEGVHEHLDHEAALDDFVSRVNASVRLIEWRNREGIGCTGQRPGNVPNADTPPADETRRRQR